MTKKVLLLEEVRDGTLIVDVLPETAKGRVEKEFLAHDLDRAIFVVEVRTEPEN